MSEAVKAARAALSDIVEKIRARYEVVHRDPEVIALRDREAEAKKALDDAKRAAFPRCCRCWPSAVDDEGWCSCCADRDIEDP